MALIINLQHFFSEYRAKLGANNMRAMVVFVGDADWSFQQFNSLTQHTSKKDDVINGEDSLKITIFSALPTIDLPHISAKNYRQFLGTEQQSIFFTITDDFQVDAFAALSGTIIAGGVMYLSITPEFIDTSLFSQRFISIANAQSNIIVTTQTNQMAISPEEFTDVEVDSIERSSDMINKHSYSITAEQSHAVDKILHVVNGHRNRPLVLTADRGRGKSTALAIAAAEILQQANKQIIISAPHPDALAIFFKHLKLLLPINSVTEHGHHQLSYQTSQLNFVPLDALVSNKPNCHLLMIDEAAGVPLPILRLLLSYYHRQVFVSTIHGYEGAGRGFSGKFLKELKLLRPEGQHLHIKQPIRWRDGDPLEQFTFSSLLLNAELKTAHYDATQDVQYQFIGATKLFADETLLQQVFSLLVTAHYQTKPSDLKMLLDNPNVSVALIQQRDTQANNILGVALLLTEGGISTDLSQKVKQSLRRIRGHLIPQSLLVHSGVEQAFNFSYQRVVRIAIHPEIQQQGLGSKLLNYCQQQAAQQGSDFIASSFGANSQLMQYWFNNHYKVARLGFTKDAASGEHSAMVLKALTPNAEQLLKDVNHNFQQSLNYYLTDEYKNLPTDLVITLLNKQQIIGSVNQQDRQACADFAQGYRVLSSCAPALNRYLRYMLTNNSVHCLQDRLGLAVLIRKVIQKHNVEQICDEFSLTGKKALIATLRSYVGEHLS
ncbi:tRNA(Met) cytidine acetyltransferase TmcA [Colwelliaceae bacterium BS250]